MGSEMLQSQYIDSIYPNINPFCLYDCYAKEPKIRDGFQNAGIFLPNLPSDSFISAIFLYSRNNQVFYYGIAGDFT